MGAGESARVRAAVGSSKASECRPCRASFFLLPGTPMLRERVASTAPGGLWCGLRAGHRLLGLLLPLDTQGEIDGKKVSNMRSSAAVGGTNFLEGGSCTCTFFPWHALTTLSFRGHTVNVSGLLVRAPGVVVGHDLSGGAKSGGGGEGGGGGGGGARTHARASRKSLSLG